MEDGDDEAEDAGDDVVDGVLDEVPRDVNTEEAVEVSCDNPAVDAALEILDENSDVRSDPWVFAADVILVLLLGLGLL